MKGIDQRLRVRQTSSGGPAVWQSPGFVFNTLKLLQSWFETPNACVKPTGAGAANACKVPEKHVTDATICNQTERIIELLAREKGVYRPRIRHAASKRPKPTIQDQVASGAGIFASPKWATRATRKRTSEITHTIIVGALPELRMTFPLVNLDGWI